MCFSFATDIIENEIGIVGGYNVSWVYEVVRSTPIRHISLDLQYFEIQSPFRCYIVSMFLKDKARINCESPGEVKFL